MKSIDDKIKHLVQSAEKEIPREVEKAFLKKLNQKTARHPFPQKGFGLFYRLALATAACLLIASFVFIPQSSRFSSGNQADEIMVQSAKIEGQNARAIIFKEQNPELTIVWVEK
jgi:hypothetical protein